MALPQGVFAPGLTVRGALIGREVSRKYRPIIFDDLSNTPYDSAHVSDWLTYIELASMHMGQNGTDPEGIREHVLPLVIEKAWHPETFNSNSELLDIIAAAELSRPGMESSDIERFVSIGNNPGEIIKYLAENPWTDKYADVLNEYLHSVNERMSKEFSKSCGDLDQLRQKRGFTSFLFPWTQTKYDDERALIDRKLNQREISLYSIQKQVMHYSVLRNQEESEPTATYRPIYYPPKVMVAALNLIKSRTNLFVKELEEIATTHPYEPVRDIAGRCLEK
jgi:hypothetical protein